MAFSQFASLSAVNADNWACTINFGVLGHHLALLVVLVFGVGACADGAYHSVLRTWAAC